MLRFIPLFTVVALMGCQSDLAPSPGGATSLHRFEYHAMKMGSDYNLVLYAPDQATADNAAKAAEVEIDRLNAIFSDYDPESEISRLSRATRSGPMPHPVPISDDLFHVSQFAAFVSEMTEGLFDVTVGPYVQLWRRSRRQQQLPSPERLAEAKSAVGWEKLQLDNPLPEQSSTTAGIAKTENRRHTAQLTAAKMRLDFGGIATGYISDRVLAVLKEHGITSALCDLSGDLVAGDPPPGRKGWRVAIQSLTEPNKAAEYLEVANRGISTSGDTYRFVEIDGVRYSHIVDSRTGLGLTHRIGVTIVAPDGMTADTIATTVSALGSEKGLAFIESFAKSPGFEGTGARITEVKDGAVNTVVSEQYKKLQ